MWPIPMTISDAPSRFGTTRVHSAGPESAPPVLLLHGGGVTSAVWFANVAALTGGHRVHAVDILGVSGGSMPGDSPMRTPADLVVWLNTVLDHLGVDTVDLVGHSYGAWLALNHAIHAPLGVRRLALLDPTTSFTGFSPRYLMHAVPMMLGRTPVRFFGWESGGRIDQAWLDRVAAPKLRKDPRRRIVMPKRPSPQALRAMKVPTLVMLAGSSRAHRIERVGAAARGLLPEVSIEVVAEASHHTMPIWPSEEINRHLIDFLG